MSRQNFFFCPKPEKPEKTGKTEPKPDKTFWKPKKTKAPCRDAD
jgi:hypothetical protein